jgi:hypothetical protein
MALEDCERLQSVTRLTPAGNPTFARRGATLRPSHLL